MFTLLIVTVLVLGFFGLNVSRYLFAGAAASTRLQRQLASGLSQVVIPVEGMTCVTCEIPVRFALKRIDGVRSVQINSAGKTVVVNYEPTKTDPKQLVAAINSTGFRAWLPNN
jgi:copper chaperone CopZ